MGYDDDADALAAGRLAAAEPPRTVIRARRPLTPQSLVERADVVPRTAEDEIVLRIHRRRREEHAALYVAEMRDLASLWCEEDDGDQQAPHALAAAAGLRTKLGRSHAPATLDGTIPIPARMARELVAKAPAFERVLADAATGAYAHTASRTYRVSRAMAENLRLIDPFCAVPGCQCSVMTVGESDHIEEFDLEAIWRSGALDESPQERAEALERQRWGEHVMEYWSRPDTGGPDDPGPPGLYPRDGCGPPPY